MNHYNIPVTIQEPEEETEPQVQGGAPDALLQDEPELDSQTQGTKQDEQAQEPGPDGAAAEPPENGAAAETAPLPWGEGTALVLSALPQEAEELLPAREEWNQVILQYNIYTLLYLYLLYIGYG